MHVEPTTWTLDGFLNHFQLVHDTMPDHQFGWVIGAGASKSSGIPTGAELAEWWLRDMYLRECSNSDLKLDEWATEQNLGIDEFKYDSAAAFYPRIYERRFKDFPEEGFAYLEHVMTGNSMVRTDHSLEEARPVKVIEPSPGYSILAKIMESQRHRVVITTNFDNLLADALQIYTDTYPFVCGHESLTGFVRVAMRRPVICKIHRDLLLAPLNDTRKLRLLHESWSATLRALLGHYTPIVVGYGGNDDSLMERLNSLERDEIKGRLIWCYYRGSDGRSQPSQRIKNLVAELDGVLVPVPDFDRLMLLLGARLGITVQDEELEKRQNARTERYRQAVLGMNTDDLLQLKPALKKMYEKAGWWWWQQRVNEHSDPQRKEDAYREALLHCPKSAELYGNFANFMRFVVEEYDEAERLYRRALELDPNHANTTSNFAVFLTDIRKDHSEAERLFQRAIELDPDHVNTISNFAIFLSRVRNQQDEAESLFRRALNLNPDDAFHAGSFAVFLSRMRKEYDEAERLFRRAIELDADDVDNNGNFAGMLVERGRFDEAKPFLIRALSLNAGEPTQMMAEVLLYRCAIEAIEAKSDLEPIRNLINRGFERFHWSFDAIYEMLKPRVSRLTLEIFKAHGEAILNADKAAVLEETLEQIQKEYSVDDDSASPAPVPTRARNKRSLRTKLPDSDTE